MKLKLKPETIATIVYGFIRFVGMTMRVKTVHREVLDHVPHGAIICGWHGRSVIAGNLFRNLGYWVIISRSKDGEIQKCIFERLGFNIIRGSTRRGGAQAAIESIRALKSGAIMAITPDGPRGPSGVVQEGVILMAQKSGAALIPVGISARPRYLVNSWDRYMLPYPFSKGLMIFGDPIYVPVDADSAVSESLRLKLQEEIHRLEKEAEEAMGFNTK